jgi:hypothetical protein
MRYIITRYKVLSASQTLEQLLESRFAKEKSQWEGHAVYLTSNQNNFFESLCTLETHKPDPKPKPPQKQKPSHISLLTKHFRQKAGPVGVSHPKTRVGLLIGESYILSSLPELSRHCDTIIMNDISTMTTKYCRFLIDTLRNSHSREEFIQKYCDNFPLEEEVVTREMAQLINISRTTVLRDLPWAIPSKTLDDLMVMMIKVDGKSHEIYFKHTYENSIRGIQEYEFQNRNFYPKMDGDQARKGFSKETRKLLLIDFLMSNSFSAQDKHFLHSEERFQQCKAALESVNVSFTMFVAPSIVLV